MNPNEAYPRLAEFCAVDVRADHEFRGPLGHISGSILIPLLDLDQRVEEIPRGRTLLLVCRSGKRSGRACERLIKLDIGPVVNLGGGMIAWNRAQFPLDRPAPDSLGELLRLATAWLSQVAPGARYASSNAEMSDSHRVTSTFEEPTRAAVESVLASAEESLASNASADFELSMASFRQWLAAF